MEIDNTTVTVSIIIPVYNLEKYIDNCLKSVVEQTYRNLEIICIDDGSTDSSAEKIKKFMNSDKRIRYHYKKNSGLSATRNFGIKLATGDYLIYIDPDDYFEKNAIEKMLETALKNSADIVCADMKFITSIGDCSVNIVEANNVEAVASVATIDNLFVDSKSGFIVNGNLYKLDFIKDMRFDSSLLNGEDAVFMLEAMLKKPKIYFLNGKYYVALIRTDSMSRNINYSLNISHLVDVSAKCFDMSMKSDSDEMKTVYLKGIYSTLFEHRIRCKDSEVEKIVLNNIKKTGRKYIKYVKTDSNLSMKEKIGIVVSLYSPIMYKLIRIFLDPTLIKYYFFGKKHI